MFGQHVLFLGKKDVRILLLGVLVLAMACGGARSTAPQGGSVSGNWQFTLSPNTSSAVVFTGFLNQSNNSVSGSLLEALISSCSGVSSVTGTVTGQNVSGPINGQNVSLNINQSGAVIGLTGTAASGAGASMSGSFTSQPGVCTSIASSGNWSAVQIAPISGSFQGSFTSLSGGVVTVKGSLIQGQNTGNSTATLSGTLFTTSGPAFCAYLLPGTVTGLISGTNVQLNLYDESGTEYAQLGAVGKPGVAASPDGKSLTGTYLFSGLQGSTCPGDGGTFNLKFP